MKIIIFIFFVLLLGCGETGQQNLQKNEEESNLHLDKLKDTADIELLYNVIIKPRENTIASEKNISRFQVNINRTILSIPFFNSDSTINSNEYGDLYKFCQMNGVSNNDSVLSFGRAYSKKVQSIYQRLGVHEVQGGIPNIGELVILKYLTGENLVYMKDTSKFFNLNWKTIHFATAEKKINNTFQLRD